MVNFLLSWLLGGGEAMDLQAMLMQLLTSWLTSLFG
jgi:hypothetical protein